MNPRGHGNLSAAEQEAALQMLREGWTQQRVADGFGVTKNIIAGLWHRWGEPEAASEATTLWTRCDALHARLDAVLAETAGVGKLSEAEVKERQELAKRFRKNEAAR